MIKKHGIKLGLAVVLVVILVAATTHLSKNAAGFLSNVSGAAQAPLQKAATAAADWLEGIYGYIYKYDQLEAERDELQAKLAQAEADLREAQEAVDENIHLKELLGLSETRTDFVFESAKIISRTASNWANTITISKGSEAGLEIGDPVVTSGGALVGQIIELGDSWAEVRTIIDLDISAGALVVGDFTLMQQGYVKLTYLTEGTNLLQGDSVLTSGKGGVFPQGLLIGTIAEVHTEAGGQTPYGVIAPGCDLNSLSQIFIITDFDTAENTEAVIPGTQTTPAPDAGLPEDTDDPIPTDDGADADIDTDDTAA